MPDEMSLGEVGRTLEGVRNTLATLASNLESGYVKKEIYEVQLKNITKSIDDCAQRAIVLADMLLDVNTLKIKEQSMTERVSALEEAKKWLVRAVAVAIIGAIVTLLFTVIKTAP